MAKETAKQSDETGPAKPVTETITYLPGNGDPASVKWCGHTFHANLPKEITGHAEGTQAEQLNHHLIERARDNKHFRVGSDRKQSRRGQELPKTSEQYRAYMVGWLQDPFEHVDQLIARFARDRELLAACEVGADDYAYLSTLFMPKLHELARADEMTEQQVAAVWINHGINQLPW